MIRIISFALVITSFLITACSSIFNENKITVNIDKGFKNTIAEIASKIDVATENPKEHFNYIAEKFNLTSDQPGNVVIARRSFSNGELFVIDDEIIEQTAVTISSELLKNYPAVIPIDNKALQIRYSRWPVAWPRRACLGFSNNGSVFLNKINERYIINIYTNISFIGQNSSASCKGSSPSLKTIEFSLNYPNKT